MRRIARLCARFCLYGVFWGWTCMAAMMTAVWAAAGAAGLEPMTRDFSRQVLWAALVGVGFTLPAVLYRLDRPALSVKILIHFGVGMGIFFPVAFSLGWIPYAPGSPWQAMLQLAIGAGIFFAIWSVFYFANRYEAKRINARVRQLQAQKDDEEEG